MMETSLEDRTSGLSTAIAPRLGRSMDQTKDPGSHDHALSPAALLFSLSLSLSLSLFFSLSLDAFAKVLSTGNSCSSRRASCMHTVRNGTARPSRSSHDAVINGREFCVRERTLGIRTKANKSADSPAGQRHLPGNDSGTISNFRGTPWPWILVCEC